ncbi:MAG: TlpA family protein disulfide reductase [Candidatus Kapaibacterium sp.]
MTKLALCASIALIILLSGCESATTPVYDLPPAPDPDDGLALVYDLPDLNAEIGARAEVDSLAPIFAWKAGSDYVNLLDYRGNVVIIDFWKIACKPCHEFVGILKPLWNEYKSRGLVVISLCAASHYQGWLDEMTTGDQSWINVADTDDIIPRHYPVFDLYGISGVPSICVIDREGRISHIGIAFQSEKLMRELIEVVI